MSTRQLKIDLHKRTRERLRQLIRDTFDLYEMADLESSDALIALTDMLMKELTKMLAASEGSAEMLGAMLALLVRYQRREISQEEVERRLGRLGVSDDE